MQPPPHQNHYQYNYYPVQPPPYQHPPPLSAPLPPPQNAYAFQYPPPPQQPFSYLAGPPPPHHSHAFQAPPLLTQPAYNIHPQPGQWVSPYGTQPSLVQADRLRDRVTRGRGKNRKRKRGTVEEEDEELNAIVQEEPARMRIEVGVKNEHEDDENGSKMPVVKTEPAPSPVGDGSTSPRIGKLSKGQRKRARLFKKKTEAAVPQSNNANVRPEPRVKTEDGGKWRGRR
ncbi:hypothetical protein HO173_005174 [Letharia columbiana]|uniref:Uncharacterized protein n=1 Tax=Letharia columbiana TaxID=112416 RepID=A0A8H6FY34_9LECA|nr:uncharacterized protein HO173_005174 [Letharia columbiana]KAF6236883.1 hypothetical protein HO173_005174 [Letharia columbiana]